MITVYANLTDNEINIRRLEIMERYNRLIQWGRQHPAHFIEQIFKVPLLDFQKWVILNTWTAEKAVWVCSRNAGKTFLGALYLMAKAMLFPQFRIHIMNVTAKQANETFAKIEDIANNNIKSLIGISPVFLNELDRPANSSGFVHHQSGWRCDLYNGSFIKTVVGKPNSVVGARSNINFYDEAGKIVRPFFEVTEPFLSQLQEFKMGANIDTSLFPPDVVNQSVYSSSAEDISTYLWDMYKLCGINMAAGIPGYFCADLNCEIPLRPFFNGEPFEPLLAQSKIDDAMKTNEAKALREYYNIFDTTGGINALLRRDDIMRNEEDYLPSFASIGKEKKYVICFDPAPLKDNSFVLVGEVYVDEKEGYKARIVNCINLVERGPDGKIIPLRTPEQLEAVRKIIDTYNGKVPQYKNVEFLIDVGAGGGGQYIAESLWSNWKDKNGKEYRGIIDLTNELAASKAALWPEAMNVCHMIEPTKYKSLMFEALQEMVQGNFITFLPPLPKDGIIEIEGVGKELTFEESLTLIQSDLLKEEVLNFVKEKTPSGKIIFKLSADKERKMHDDRAYTAAMLAWHLYNLREDNRATPITPNDWNKAISDRLQQGAAINKNANPFRGASLPDSFRRR